MKDSAKIMTTGLCNRRGSKTLETAHPKNLLPVDLELRIIK